MAQHDYSWTTNFQLIPLQLQLPTLSDVAEALQYGMIDAFREVNVDVVNCPCLTREPFNLAGIGLSGNTSIIKFGHELNLYPTPCINFARWNIRELLSSTCYDSFIIGSGYAAKPYMPYNGHLIMNATYRAPAGITNASRVVFAEACNGQRRIETLTGPDEMMCSFMGNAFVSEGREGHVLRVRARGRETDWDIISLMQNILYLRYFLTGSNTIVALGGVLKIRNGQAAQFVMPHQYPPQVSTFNDLVRWFQCHDTILDSDLIAVGTISNSLAVFWHEQRYGSFLPRRTQHFHSFSNYGVGGQFINDTTKDTIEYEGYFNLASTMYFTPDHLALLPLFS